jgi:hypothetical protein
MSLLHTGPNVSLETVMGRTRSKGGLVRVVLAYCLPHPLIEQSCMDTFLEYIIAGGPKHGEVYRRLPDTRASATLVVITADGQRCLPAALKQAGAQLVLLHPEATGAQFRSILAA